MSISQFDDVLHRSTEPAGRTDQIRIAVKGPLHLHPDVTYTYPLVVQFEIIQNLPDPERPGEELHDPKLARRKAGVAILDADPAGEWVGHLDVDEGFFRNGRARGVGVAVLPQERNTQDKGVYAVETLTWCDNIDLDIEGQSAA